MCQSVFHRHFQGKPFVSMGTIVGERLVAVKSGPKYNLIFLKDSVIKKNSPCEVCEDKYSIQEVGHFDCLTV